MTTDRQTDNPDSLRDARRFIAALCVTSFLATLMYASLSPFFSEIGDDLDASVPAMGQVVTARVVLSAGLAILAGPFADRFGYRRSILAGLLALALTFLGVSVSQSYAMLLLTSIPGGVAGATLGGLPLALAGSSFSGDARKRAISYTVAALSSSAIAGVPLLTTASAVLGWRGVFFASSVVALLATLFIWNSLPPDPPVDRSSRFALSSITVPYRTLLGDSQMARLYASTFLRATGWIGYLTYVGAYLADEVGFGVGAIGLVYMLSGSGYFAGSLVAGRMDLPWSPSTVASVMTIVSSLMLLLVAATPGVPALVVAGVAGMATASSLAWVMFTTMMVTMTPASQGITMSFNSTIQNLGAATGGIFGGVLIAVSGYQLMGAGLGFLLALSGVLILVVSRSFEHEARPQTEEAMSTRH